ncbi:MAG: hypothetical protein LBP26_06525, partial [Clostridiales bacterium]|nr:hypothetical protein [Clostridiales bacterium]
MDFGEFFIDMSRFVVGGFVKSEQHGAYNVGMAVFIGGNPDKFERTFKQSGRIKALFVAKRAVIIFFYF